MTVDWTPTHRNAFLRILRQELGADYAALSEPNPDHTVFVHHTAVPESPLIEPVEIPFAQSAFCAKVMSDLQPFAVREASGFPEGFGCSLMKAEGLEGYLGVPLLQDGLAVGVLSVTTWLPRLWTPDDIQKLTYYAHLLMTPDAAVPEPERHLQVVRN